MMMVDQTGVSYLQYICIYIFIYLFIYLFFFIYIYPGKPRPKVIQIDTVHYC